MFGLGYERSSDKTNNQLNKKQIPPVEETFTRADHLFGNQITMIEDEAYIEEVSNWICQVAPDKEIKNQNIMEIPKIFRK